MPSSPPKAQPPSSMCTQHLHRLMNFQAKGQKTKTFRKRLYENCINSSLTKAHLRLSNFKGNTNCCTFRHTSELHFCLTTFWGWKKNSRVTASSLYSECISQAYKNHPQSLHLQIQADTFLSCKCTRVLTEQTLLLPAATFTTKLMALAAGSFNSACLGDSLTSVWQEVQRNF